MGSAGNKSGSFSLAQTGAGTPAAGTDAETTAGVATTDTWIAQANWNGDPLDGTGPSGVTLNPAKGNVYQIGVQYLGFGSIEFKVETTNAEANGAQFVTVHTIKYPNTATGVNLSQPSFPFLAAASSAGSTTNVSVSVGSYAGFIEGEELNLGPRISYNTDASVTSSTSAYTPIFTARNALVFKTRANQCVVKLLNVTGACKSNTGLTSFSLLRNATLTGTPNFTQFATNSCTYWDTAATGCSISANSQVIWSGLVSESGQIDHIFGDKEITLQPDETVTLAVRSVTATAVCIGSLNTREDQ